MAQKNANRIYQYIAVLLVVTIALAGASLYYLVQLSLRISNMETNVSLLLPTAAKEPVNVGLLTALSPPGDYLGGAEVLRGAKLGIAYVNDHGGVLGGRPLNLVVADDSGLPEKAAAAMLKLILDDKVVAVFGATQSSVMKAEQPVAEQYSVAQFSTAASSPTITAAHYNTTFRTHAMDSDKIQMFLEWVNAAGKHKIAGLFENTDSGISQLTWMRDNLTAFAPNAELRSFTYELTVVDFTALLLQIKDYGADALWLGGTGAQNLLIMKQALDVGLYPSTPTTGAADWAVRSDYWDALGQNGIGICFVAFYSPNQKRTQLGDDGFNLYLRDYGTPPVYEAINAFGQANIIAQAINQANSTDSALIVQALRTGTFTHWNSDNVTFPEIGGPYWHQWAPPMMILQITSFRQPYTQMPIIAPAALKTADFKPPPY